MQQSLYDLQRLIARAEAWRSESDRATFGAMHAFCLEEARRCEETVRRSLETPPLAVTPDQLSAV